MLCKLMSFSEAMGRQCFDTFLSCSLEYRDRHGCGGYGFGFDKTKGHIGYDLGPILKTGVITIGLGFYDETGFIIIGPGFYDETGFIGTRFGFDIETGFHGFDTYDQPRTDHDFYIATGDMYKTLLYLFAFELVGAMPITLVSFEQESTIFFDLAWRSCKVACSAGT